MMPRGRFLLAVVLVVGACDRLPPSKDAPTPTSPALSAPAAPAPAPAPPSYRTQQQVLTSEPVRAAKPRQAGIRTPPPGSPDRVALMNALRGAVRNDLGGDVVFVVQDLRTDGDWAFAVLQPTWPDGRRITPETTPLYRRRDAEGLDGLRTEAVWRKEGGRWQVVAHAVGATDAWWTAYCDRVPSGLMSGC